ncbi:membrane protein [Formosimonas limnophila]|uniref:Membrane protein n=2 Tax=Formosimonas limnophila TaxID=1384487 RepID=A0A8J3G0E1_9BURK|nr:membrane protein [Formosimonas limnophila]
MVGDELAHSEPYTHIEPTQQVELATQQETESVNASETETLAAIDALKSDSAQYAAAKASAAAQWGISVKAVNAKLKAWRKTEKRPYIPEPYQQVDGVAHGFVVNDIGVWFNADDEALRVCSRLDVLAWTRDDKSESWGRLLRWQDGDKHPHHWAMPIELSYGIGVELAKSLSMQGLEISPARKALQKLADYVVGCKPAARARCVSKTGWCRDVYVLPQQTLGDSDDRAIYQSADGAANPYSSKGTLSEWRKQVAALCVGNSRCVLAVSMAFAGVLLPLAGVEGGGVHIVGSSSTGKSTTTKAAASVYGQSHEGAENKYWHSWRATDNGLEGIASLHNHSLLILDELRQTPAKTVGEAVYMLANGEGKNRANRNGASKPVKSWQLLYLSNGELTLEAHMATVGMRPHEGQEVRFAKIEANAGAGLGIFEQLNGYADGAALSDAFKAATTRQYGTAGIEFIRYCIVHYHSLKDELQHRINGFVDRNIPADAQGQVQRVAQRFGLIAAAGEYASQWGITGWQQGEATQAAQVCFKNWLDNRSSHGDNQEKESMLEAVRSFILRHSASRFSLADSAKDEKILNQAGWIRHSGKVMDYLIIPDVFRQEVCAGFEVNAVCRALDEEGLIYSTIEDSKKRYSVKQSFGSMRTRFYTIPSTILDNAA